MLTPHHVLDLTVDPLAHPRGLGYLSAASGLVRVQSGHGDRLYVVADDELHLGVLQDVPDGAANAVAKPSSVQEHHVRLVRLFEGKLPKDKLKRKKEKPDLETLALLPAFAGCPVGALLALGSGSRASRETGVLISLDADGWVTERIAHIDLTELYAPLRNRFADLNIEGAFIGSGELRLLQRGNKGNAASACISFDWNHVAAWLAGQRKQAPVAKNVQVIDLGAVDGVPLSLTDGAPLAGGAWAFCAVAENTDDSFADGPCAASAVGVVDASGQVLVIKQLQGAPKVEGLAVLQSAEDLVISLVTDADDPSVPSSLLRVRLGWPGQP